jgi:uncharacterized protein
LFNEEGFMLRLLRLAFTLALVVSVFPRSASSQFSRVVGDKRIIEIRTSEKVIVPAEIATVKIGFQNQAASKDDAYLENTKASAKIIQALIDAKLPKEAIETQTISLERQEEMNGPNAVRPALFVADQEWRIHVKASEAQKVVDVAVAAGANQVSDVDWAVSDPRGLEAKAYAAALRRARVIAESTATQAELKLGEILSITNSASPLPLFGALNTESATLSGSSAFSVKTTPLTLFPPSIEREASVTVVFAIEK